MIILVKFVPALRNGSILLVDLESEKFAECNFVRN